MKHLNVNQTQQKNSFKNKILKEKLPCLVVVTIDKIGVVDSTKIEHFIL